MGAYVLTYGYCEEPYFGLPHKDSSHKIAEHKHCVRNGRQSSAIFNHVSIYNHKINWDAAQVTLASTSCFKSKGSRVLCD